MWHKINLGFGSKKKGKVRTRERLREVEVVRKLKADLLFETCHCSSHFVGTFVFHLRTYLVATCRAPFADAYHLMIDGGGRESRTTA